MISGLVCDLVARGGRPLVNSTTRDNLAHIPCPSQQSEAVRAAATGPLFCVSVILIAWLTYRLANGDRAPFRVVGQALSRW